MNPGPGAAGAQRRPTDWRLPIRPPEEAADLLPQLCRHVVPVSSPVTGQQHHADAGANLSVEEKVPRPRPGPHGVVDEPTPSRTDVGRARPKPAPRARTGGDELRRGRWGRHRDRDGRSARLASSARRHATKILKADHDEAAVRKAATPTWPRAVAMATAVRPSFAGSVTDPPLPASHCTTAR